MIPCRYNDLLPIHLRPRTRKCRSSVGFFLGAARPREPPPMKRCCPSEDGATAGSRFSTCLTYGIFTWRADAAMLRYRKFRTCGLRRRERPRSVCLNNDRGHFCGPFPNMPGRTACSIRGTVRVSFPYSSTISRSAIFSCFTPGHYTAAHLPPPLAGHGRRPRSLLSGGH